MYNTTQYIPSPKKTRGSAAKIVALSLCCSLVGGTTGALGMAVYDHLFQKAEETFITKTSEEDDSSSRMYVGERDENKLDVVKIDSSKVLTAAEIYAANVNSTVGITTKVTTNSRGRQVEGTASGSGFVFTSDGYIVTNYHVVEGGSSIKVSTYDNNTYDAKLVGYDESNDIAVLKVDGVKLTPVVIGDSDKMNVGDNVIAIGNPLGELTFSLTAGMVSALNRQVTIDDLSMNLIQTDCAINSGNSGGALFNSYGEVIGMTNAKYSSSGSSSSASIDNIGFAIPSNTVSSIVTSIIEKGYVEKVYIGVTVSNLGNGQRNLQNVQGVQVISVVEDSPAEKAGVEKGDIITAVNGEKITSSSGLTSWITKSKAGDVLTLSIMRDGENIELKVTLGVRQQTALPEDNESNDPDQGSDWPGGWDMPNGGRD